MAGEGFWQEEAGSGGGTNVGGLGTIELAVDAAPHTLQSLSDQKGWYSAEAGRTYIAYNGLERDLYVTYYEHATGTLATPVEVDTYPIADDNQHGAPTIAVTSDGKIHVVWGAHNTAHRHCISDAAHDISAWTCTDIHTGTYPKITVVGDDLYLFDRAGSGHTGTFPSHEFAGIRIYSSGSWNTYAALIDTTGVPAVTTSDCYIGHAQYSEVDGLIHLGWRVTAGASHNTGDNGNYHATYDPSDGSLAAADGTDLGTSITWAEHADCEIEALASATIGSPDILVSTDGTTLYAAYTKNDAHTVATWNGTAWSVASTGIDATGTYSGWHVIEHDGALLGIFNDQPTGQISNIVVAFSPDGASWYEGGTLLEGSSGNGFTRIAFVVGGPWLALTAELPTGEAFTSATAADLQSLYAITAPVASATHTHANGGGSSVTALDDLSDVDTTTAAPATGDLLEFDGTNWVPVDGATTVKDSGRWEVVVTGSSPPVATTNGAGDDWLYTWVPG